MPPRPKMPRWVFVRSSIVRAAWQLFLADIANTYILAVGAPDAPSSHGYALRYSTIVAWVGLTHAMVNAQYFALATVSISLGTSLPEDWPDVFGKWSDAYTLRNFWGSVCISATLICWHSLIPNSKVWHQNLRRVCSTSFHVFFPVLCS